MRSRLNSAFECLLPPAKLYWARSVKRAIMGEEPLPWPYGAEGTTAKAAPAAPPPAQQDDGRTVQDVAIERYKARQLPSPDSHFTYEEVLPLSAKEIARTLTLGVQYINSSHVYGDVADQPLAGPCRGEVPVVNVPDDPAPIVRVVTVGERVPDFLVPSLTEKQPTHFRGKGSDGLFERVGKKPETSGDRELGLEFHERPVGDVEMPDVVAPGESSVTLGDVVCQRESCGPQLFCIPIESPLIKLIGEPVKLDRQNLSRLPDFQIFKSKVGSHYLPSAKR